MGNLAGLSGSSLRLGCFRDLVESISVVEKRYSYTDHILTHFSVSQEGFWYTCILRASAIHKGAYMPEFVFLIECCLWIENIFPRRILFSAQTKKLLRWSEIWWNTFLGGLIRFHCFWTVLLLSVLDIYIAEMPGIGGIWRIQHRYAWKGSLIVCCSFFTIRKRFRDQNPVSSRGAVSVCSYPGLWSTDLRVLM